MISRENTPGNYAASPDAPPVQLDPTYSYVWDYFRSEERRRQQESWFPAPPPELSVIKKQMLYECFKYPTMHWLLQWDPWVNPRHPARRFIERISRMRVGVDEVKHYLSTNRSSMLNQGISATQGEYGQIPALFSMGLLRRNCAGLGFKHKAVAKQNLALAKTGPASCTTQSFANSLLGMQATCPVGH